MATSNNIFQKQVESAKNALSQGNTASNLSSTSLNINNLSGIVTPLITNIFKADTNINASIDRLVLNTQNQLGPKGKVAINNGKITFVPIKNESYNTFQQNFNNTVSSIKNQLSILNNKINALKTFSNILDKIISILNKKFIAEQLILLYKTTSSNAEQTSPSPSKPLTGQLLQDELNKTNYRLNKLEGKPALPIPPNRDDLILGVLNALSIALKGLIAQMESNYVALIDRINKLQLTISNSNQPELNNVITPASTDGLTETYNNYILQINKLADNSYQAVAIDKTTGLKIAQTAPSKFIKPDALFSEIKQILNT
jgi:hypothetical protein